MFIIVFVTKKLKFEKPKGFTSNAQNVLMSQRQISDFFVFSVGSGTMSPEQLSPRQLSPG